MIIMPSLAGSSPAAVSAAAYGLLALPDVPHNQTQICPPGLKPP